MNKRTLKFMTLVSASFVATSCSLFETKYYDWLFATKNNTEINYCLLIGQNEHSDSIERTRGTRKALDTYDENTLIKNNANLSEPKVGHIILDGTQNGSVVVPKKEFTVHEIEHAEQKSLAAVTWDAITANATTGTWISAHGKNITLFVSNNDGMAEGAIRAGNWIQGLPIFGYDANASTIKLISEHKIMGTMDQNAPCQTAAAYMMIRNIIDDTKSGKVKEDGIKYSPLWSGFTIRDKQSRVIINNSDHPNKYGYINCGATLPSEDKDNAFGMGGYDYTGEDPDPTTISARDMLLHSLSVSETNVSKWMNGDRVKTVEEFANNDVHLNEGVEGDKISVCHIYNNAAEVYLKSTMAPYSHYYDDYLNLEVEDVDGDGVDETRLLNQIGSKTAFDAYLVNMVTTTDASAFIKAIAEKLKVQPKDKWEDRSDIPVLFWNKQPQNIDGTKDTLNINNKYFKHTYYVGVDAAYGGDLQGELIRNYLNQRYIKSVEEANKK